MDIKYKNGLLKLLGLDKTIDHLTGYVETRLELYKIQFQEQIAKAISVLALILVLVAVFGLTVVFLSLALANHLNEMFESQFIGFLIVAAVYLIAGILILIYKEKLIYELTYRFFFSDDEEENISEDENND